jgi:hypothetical protein
LTSQAAAPTSATNPTNRNKNVSVCGMHQSPENSALCAFLWRRTRIENDTTNATKRESGPTS